jgi:hypothetical protein
MIDLDLDLNLGYAVHRRGSALLLESSFIIIDLAMDSIVDH